MKKRINNRSWKAILLVCAWAVLVLCGPVSVHSTKANAAESNSLLVDFDEEIEVMGTPSLNGGSDESEWGTFYRGIKMPAESHYVNGELSNMPSTIIWGEWLDETKTYYLFTDLSSEEKPLYSPMGVPHDFITNAGNGDWVCCDDNGDPDGSGDYHWAVCCDDDCGSMLQVAHRPDKNGVCQDCGASLVEGLDFNTYSFTIPDTFPDDPEFGGSWEENGEIVATIEIPVSANLLLGWTLALSMAYTNGQLVYEGGEAAIPYEIEVSFEITYTDDVSSGEYASDFPLSITPDPNYSDGENENVIWEFVVDNYVYDEYGNDNLVTSIEGTITVTLILQVDNEDLSLYSGDYSETLTFSAALTSEGS